MQKHVLLCLHPAENTEQRNAEIQDKTDKTDQTQRQNKFHNTHMPFADNTIYGGRTAEISYKRQSSPNGKYQCQYSA